jgi:hypothetical protein
MDTLRDKHLLENLWASGAAPWKVENNDDASTTHRAQRIYRVGDVASVEG